MARKNKLMADFQIGAISGAIIYLLIYVLNLLKIPQIQVTFSTIEVPLREQLTTTSGQLATNVLGLINAQFSLWGVLLSALGMGIIYVVGSMIVEGAKLKLGKLQKLTAIIAIGSLVAGWFVARAISIPTISALVVLTVASLATAVIIIALEKQKIIKIN